MSRQRILGVGLIVLGGIITVGVLFGAQSVWPMTEPTPTPIWQDEPIVPTAVPSQASMTPTHTSVDMRVSAESLSFPSNAVSRFGVGVPYPDGKIDRLDELVMGWYLAWRVLETPPIEAVEFWQMIRVKETEFFPDEATIKRVAQNQPGTTWLIGNEPDVIWQDNVTPATYINHYHKLYHLIKAADPTAQIAIGGVTQPTPLRLRYLDKILTGYERKYGETMPVDVWNVHNFILPEKRDSWGVDIPPGLPDDQGILYEMAQHDDLQIFEEQLIAFRQWMADRGQRDKPLIVSEYGLLMPEDYGFDTDRVIRFMIGTYQIMLTATNDDLGYPADDNRLVQRWAWYSLSDDRYATGNMLDLTTGELTEIGKAHQRFVATLK